MSRISAFIASYVRDSYITLPPFDKLRMTIKEESPQPLLRQAQDKFHKGEQVPLLLKEGLGVVDTSSLFFVVARFIERFLNAP
jgi:hypothetical protein